MTSLIRGASGLGIRGVSNRSLYKLAFKVGGEAFHPTMVAVLRFGIVAILVFPGRGVALVSSPGVGAALLGPIMLIGTQPKCISVACQ